MSIELRTIYHPNDQKKSEGRYNGYYPVGDQTSWHENGNKKHESTEMDACWYENGQRESKGALTDYLKTGLWTEWFKNGIKKSEGFYKGEDARDGEWRFWHSNGQLAYTGIHKVWAGDGLWIFWDEAGNKIHKREYREFELLDVWKNLRADGCSDELVDKYKKYIFD